MIEKYNKVSIYAIENEEYAEYSFIRMIRLSCKGRRYYAFYDTKRN